MANAVSAARRRTVRAHLQEEDDEEEEEEEEDEEEVWRFLFFDEADASGSKARSDALCRRCESIRGPVELCCDASLGQPQCSVLGLPQFSNQFPDERCETPPTTAARGTDTTQWR